MADDEAISAKVTSPIRVDVELQDATPRDAWVSRPVSESVNEAMDNAPLGAMHELVYAALAQRLRTILDPNSSVGGLITNLVHTAVNFRSLNHNFAAGGGHVPTVPPNAGAGAGSYHSSIWSPSPDERLPATAPMANPAAAYAAGQNPANLHNKGLLIAKLFADLQHHLPLVLFNMTSETPQALGVGGSAVSRRFFKNGAVVSELGYRAMISVEATAVTQDDESASNLQGIIKAAFSTLRDQVGTGSTISGRSWQLTMPTQISPSSITELDAPWSQGDDKGSKLYSATVGLESMMFECIVYVQRPVNLLITNDLSFEVGTGVPSIYLAASGETDPEEPLILRLGHSQRLVVANASVTTDLVASQSKRVIELRKPYQGSGFYEIIPRRTGEANLFLYETHMTVSATTSERPSARVGDPLVKRKVVVTAV